MKRKPHISYFKRNRIKLIRFGFIGLFVIIWTVFIDSHKLINWIGYKSKTDAILKEKQYYLDKIEKDSLRLYELNTNNKNLEKYAREKYLMKKPEEEIFLVNEKNSK